MMTIGVGTLLEIAEASYVLCNCQSVIASEAKQSQICKRRHLHSLA